MKRDFWIIGGPYSDIVVDRLLSMQARNKGGKLRKSTVENMAAKYGCTVTWANV